MNAGLDPHEPVAVIASATLPRGANPHLRAPPRRRRDARACLRGASHHRHWCYREGESQASRPRGQGARDGGVTCGRRQKRSSSPPRAPARARPPSRLRCIAAFRRRGLTVRAAKCGPDYIDPAFHAEAAGAPCLNLDSWAMGPALLDSVAYEASSGADLLIVESAMGLFDGAGTGADRRGRRRRACRPPPSPGPARARCRGPGAIRRRVGARLCQLRSARPHRRHHS